VCAQRLWLSLSLNYNKYRNTGQESKGLPYEKLKPVYVILISNQTIFDKYDKYLSLIQYRFEDGTMFSNKLNIFTLELSKLEEPSNIHSSILNAA
jgi:hypothetical protein